MTPEANPPSPTTTPSTSLRGGHIRMPELAAQSIGLVGVSGGVGMLIPAVYGSAGPHTWLAYVFAVVALLFASWSIAYFARQTASSGALYTFAARGFGPWGGLLCGSFLLIAYAVGGAGILLGTANTLSILLMKTGVLAAQPSVASTLALIATLALAVGYLSARDLLLSTRITLVVELVTIALIVAVVVGFLASGSQPVVDRQQLSLASLNFQQLHPGMVLAFFSFVGFESATTLGSEARSPLTAIPRAILISILGPAAVFIISAYAMAGAFPGTPGLAQVDGPLSTMAQQLGFGSAGVFIEAGVVLSFFVACLSSVNAGSRIAFTLARDGSFPASVGRSHARHATPHVAVFWLVGLAVAGSAGLLLAGVSLLDAYGWLSTLGTYGYLLAYLMVVVAAPWHLQKKGGLQAWHLALSAVAAGLLCVPIVGSVYPVPEGVYGQLPYVFIAMVAVHLALVFSAKRARAAVATFAEPEQA